MRPLYWKTRAEPQGPVSIAEQAVDEEGEVDRVGCAALIHVGIGGEAAGEGGGVGGGVEDGEQVGLDVEGVELTVAVHVADEVEGGQVLARPTADGSEITGGIKR